MADLLPSTPDVSAAQEAEPRVIGVDSDDADDLLGALSSETSRELLAALHSEPANPAKLADAVDTSLQNAQYHLSNLEDAGLIEVVDTAYSEKGREMNVYAPSDRPLVVYAGKEEETTGLRAALSRLLGAVTALAFSSVLVQELFGNGVGGMFQLGSAPGGGAIADTETPTGEPGVYQPADVTTTSGTGDTPAATGTPTSAPADATATATPEAGATSSPAATGTPTQPPSSTPTDVATEATRTVTDTATATPAGDAVGTSTPSPQPVVEAVAGAPPGLLFFAGGALVLLLVAGWRWRTGR